MGSSRIRRSASSSALANTLSDGPSAESPVAVFNESFFLKGKGTFFVVVAGCGFGGRGIKIVGAGAVSSTSPSSGDELRGRFAYLPPSGDLDASLLRGVETVIDDMVVVVVS